MAAEVQGAGPAVQLRGEGGARVFRLRARPGHHRAQGAVQVPQTQQGMNLRILSYGSAGLLHILGAATLFSIVTLYSAWLRPQPIVFRAVSSGETGRKWAKVGSSCWHAVSHVLSFVHELRSQGRVR